MRTAALYARFSCSKQREASIDDQLRVCREWCLRNGYEVVAEYADYAISGRTDDRPQFQKMVANAGESDIVLVYMMDRFSRDEFDAPIYKRELTRKGVRLVSALEAIPDSPEGIIYEKLLEGLAACESRKTSVRVRRGMEGNALQCKTNGYRVYGYREGPDGKFEVDPEQARIVREIFERRASGETCHSIALDLKQRGVMSHRHRPASYNFVYGITKNEKYRGVYQWADVRIEGGMPRIIPDELFWRVQGVKGKKQRANEDWGDFALSGKVICSGCGHSMPGVSGHGRSGKKYEYYACNRCDMKAVRRDWLESELCGALRETLSDPATTRELAHMLMDSEDWDTTAEDRELARKSLQNAEQGLRNILAAIEQGIIPPGAKERIAELEEQRDRAKRDLASFDPRMNDPECFAQFLMDGINLSDEELLTAFVYQVMVTPDEVIATLNYDTDEKEPARISIERVLTFSEWCAIGKTPRTQFLAVGGTVYLRFRRAA